MSILIQHNTRDAIGEDAQKCNSRSLFFDRFSYPGAKDRGDDTPRKNWFQKFIARRSEQRSGNEWLPPKVLTLYGRLCSRLLVGMGNGVMENAGVTIDRYGWPYLPGSAIKGCARRAALAALRYRVDKNNGLEIDPDSPLATIWKSESSSSDALIKICLIFGWIELDWEVDSDKRSKSDLAWACGPDFLATWKIAAESLADQLGVKIPANKSEAPWECLPTYGGAIAFLEARPNRDPEFTLDVLTPHHSDYYASKDAKAEAMDNEDPVPVFFPAVKAQEADNYFSFPMLPLRFGNEERLDLAYRSLSVGLGFFGIGAKANAGYGWFDASVEFNQKIALVKHSAKISAEFENDLADFHSIGDSEKEDAILRLSDRLEDVRLWATTNSKLYQEVKTFAESQGISLT
jgi:CRISPR-associated protein Cmr6